MSFELYGEKGRLAFTNMAGQFTIEFTDAKTNEKQILTPPPEFEAIQSGSYVNLILGIEDEYTARINHGLECQAVIDAAIRSSEQHRPVSIAAIKAGA